MKSVKLRLLVLVSATILLLYGSVVFWRPFHAPARGGGGAKEGFGKIPDESYSRVVDPADENAGTSH